MMACPRRPAPTHDEQLLEALIAAVAAEVGMPCATRRDGSPDHTFLVAREEYRQYRARLEKVFDEPTP
jgi:hypothetical protein